ncbi:MAG: GerMN domain-containing protein [Nocardioidaceae bacterium]|nr:GerMN domain-containing protein [Nocardioidaceae bacterium]
MIRLPCRRLAVVVLAAVTMAGCVSIPTDSSISRGRDVGVRDEPQLNSNLPPGPASGASREDIVAGFFDAMLAYPRQDALAREFLTQRAAEEWTPDQSLVVYDDQEVTDGPDRVTVQALRLGTLDSRGAWTSSTPATSKVNVSLRTELVDGQWRIENPPVGTYIDADYFDRYLEPFSLYFFDPTETILTPDPIYLPLGESTLALLVEDLLRGPSLRLAGIVSTAAPRGLTVAGAVTLSTTGRAQIPLSSQAREMSGNQRRLLAAQLTWTLKPLTEVESIVLTVDGKRIEVPGSGAAFGIDAFSGYDPAGFGASLRQLFGLSSRGLVTVSVDGTSPVTGSIGRGHNDARSGAVEPSGDRAALVDAVGHRLVVGEVSTAGTGTSVWFRNGTDLLRPSWDIHHVLWVVDATAQGAAVYTLTAGRSRRVEVAGISGETVLGFAVSRDGARLAAIVRERDKTKLLISIIDRSSERPADVDLSAAEEVEGPDVTFSGTDNVTWLSPTSVAVLANDDGGDLQPFEVRIDGSNLSTFDGFLPIRPVTIAAAPNPDVPLVVGSSNARLYLRSPEAGWAAYSQQAKVRQPFYPG